MGCCEGAFSHLHVSNFFTIFPLIRMGEMLILAGFAIVFLFCAYVCFNIAKNNNMNTNTWVAMGATLGPIGVVIAYLVSLYSAKK